MRKEKPKNKLFLLIIAVIISGLSLVSIPAGAEKQSDQGKTQLSKFQKALPPISGTKSIGPTGDYTSIGTAINDIQTQGLGGALLLELQPAYLSNVETFPLNVTALTGISSTNTVTLRPQAGATDLKITGDDATAIINLEDVEYLTIDGRPGGTGTAKELTIENTNTNGATVRFINEASNNVLKFVVLKGATTNPTNGVVFFGTTTGANGNDNNTIENSDIREGVSEPLYCIFSHGTTSTSEQNNSNNTITGNNIFNFHSTINDPMGIRIVVGNTDWIITNNNFYQTNVRSGSGRTTHAVNVDNTSGNNFTISGNNIGGSEPGAGGDPWTNSGTTMPARFVGINLRVGTSFASNVQGNTVKNFLWETSSDDSTAQGVFCALYPQRGTTDIGTTTGNTVGSDTGTGSIRVTTSGDGGTTHGLCTFSFAFRNVANNRFGSIETNGTDPTVSAPIVVVEFRNGFNTFRDNTIGSTTTPNSINADNSSTSPTGQRVVGVFTLSGSGSIIERTTISNLNNNYAGTDSSGQTIGMLATRGVNTIREIDIFELSATSGNTGTGDEASVAGIIDSSTSSDQNISQNIVHELFNSNTGAVQVVAIHIVGSSVGKSEVTRNLVYDLETGGADGTATGIGNDGKTWIINNMVRLGIDGDGNSQTKAQRLICLDDENGKAEFILHNSFFIGGSNVENGSNDTAALRVTVTTDPPKVFNNIAVSERSNATNGGSHSALDFSGPAVVVRFSDNNIIRATGTGGAVGRFNSIPRISLQDWRRAVGQDGSSSDCDPKFVDPNAPVPDLHLQTNNPAVGSGTPVADFDPSPFPDFDGDARPAPDVYQTTGADHNSNFTSTADKSAPEIELVPLSNGSPQTVRVLTQVATIRDNVGVSDGANTVRFYYKKSTDNDDFNGPNDSSFNGWKFAVASNASSPYSVPVDYTKINGGGVTVGDTIQLFVVAQDDANNMNSNPVGAGSSADPPVQNVDNSPPVVVTFEIREAISGTKTVGPGGDFSSLTKTGGLFEDINNKVVAGDIDVTITSDSTEDGTHPLKELSLDDPNTPFTLTLRGSGGTPITLSGDTTISGADSMVRFENTDNVVVDGGVAGLTLDNADTSKPTLKISGSASNLTFTNLTVRGANTDSNSGVWNIEAGEGNENITLDKVNVLDSNANPGSTPANLVYSQSDGADRFVENLTIRDSNFANFTNTAIFAHDNRGTLISGNLICSDGTLSLSLAPGDLTCGSSAATTNLVGIDAYGDVIAKTNNIRINTNGVFSIGARFANTTGGTSMYSSNRVTIGSPDGSSGSRVGVEVLSGGIDIINNQITIRSNNADQRIIGIDNEGFFGGGDLRVIYNTVLITGTASGSDTTTAYQKGTSAATDDFLRNNFLFNNRTGGGADHFAIRLMTTDGSYNSDNNFFVGTGAVVPDQAFEFIFASQDFDEFAFVTFQDTFSAFLNGVSIEEYDTFEDPDNGDLDIVEFEASLNGDYEDPPVVSNAGVPVPGVTDDFGGTDTRHPIHPDIGSDEGDVNRTLSTNGTLPPGNYDNITVENGVTATLSGITNIGGTFGLDCTGAISGASATNYIIGNIKKDFCSPGAFNYPVGTSTGFSPVDVSITNLATNPSGLEIRANDGVAPAAPPLDGSSVLNRFWTINETGDLTADLLFNYLQADVFGNESQYGIIRVPGSGLAQYLANNAACDPDGPVTNISPCVYWDGPNQMFISGIEDFSDWAAGIPLAPTAAALSVQGRVIVGKNRGIKNALVSLTGGSLTTPRIVRTNQFGYFSFGDVEAGQVYVLSVRHKRYGFGQNTQVFMLTEDMNSIIFEATWEN